MKKVSIIIPNYNNDKFLERCFNSINDQIYENIEVIIVDDGSTDDSKRIIENYRCKYDLKRIFQFNQNGSIARNRGIEIATGDYLFFLDSDDELYDENSILNLVKGIKDSDLIISNYEIIDENNNKIEQYIVNENLMEFDNNYKYLRTSPVPSNKLFLTSIVRRYCIYFSNVRIGQDLNFYLKYLSVCKKINILEKNIYKYRIVQNSVTRKNDLIFMDICNSFKEIEKFYKENNMLNDYNFYITNIAISHYHAQLLKVNEIKNLYERKMLFAFFDFCVKENNKKCSNKSKYYKKQLKIYFIKKILSRLKLYNILKKKVVK